MNTVPFLKLHSRVDPLTIQDIKKLIPHRYPFLLIDRVEEIQLGVSAVGIKNVTANEWFFEGHFPDHPVMPGVLIIEAMAQTAGALVVKSLMAQQPNISHEGKLVYFMSISEAKFRKPVVPGDVLKLHVVKDAHHGNVWRFIGTAYVDNVKVSEATFTAMIKEDA